jgi:hypothetical protein
MDSDPAVEIASFDALPEPVLRVVMLALPVDERARTACVCRSWRAFLADPSLWQVLDLTPAGGVAAARVTENLVRRAVARAAGQLRVLRLNSMANTGMFFQMSKFLVELVVSFGAQLQQVTTDSALHVEDLNNLFAAAPRLQVLNAGVTGSCTELLPILRNDPPYGPLQVCHLDALQPSGIGMGDALALASAAAAHESLKSVAVMLMHTARGLNALVDAAAERRVAQLSILHCDLDAESVPALARLLRRGSLTKLEVICQGFPHAQEESMPVLCAALRSCPTLTHLLLPLHPPDGVSRRNVTELLDVAAALPALSTLDLCQSHVQDAAAFGRALGALLAANLPNLHTLRVDHCHLGDEGLAPLLDGLAANTHLRELDCYENGISWAFGHNRLTPALAALAAHRQLESCSLREAW